jgi:hypothetical protein
LIAKYPPKSHSDAKTIDLFVPNWGAVQKYKDSPKSKADWEAYVETYRKTCRSRWKLIEQWLGNLNPAVDTTLCLMSDRPSAATEVWLPRLWKPTAPIATADWMSKMAIAKYTRCSEFNIESNWWNAGDRKAGAFELEHPDLSLAILGWARAIGH